MSMPEDYLKAPEDYLPMVGPVPGSNIVPEVLPKRAVGEVPLAGPGKYVGQFVRGATLGLAGDPEAPANIPQMLTEGLGMAAPFAAVATPVTAGLGAIGLRTYPILARTIGGAAAGALTGAAHAGVTGGPVAQEALLGGATGAVGELAWGAWANRAKFRSAPEQVEEALAAKAGGQPPPGPPGLVRGGPFIETPRVARAGPFADPNARPPEPLGPWEPLGPPSPEAGPVYGPYRQAEQLHLPDTQSATQLELPMGIMPSGRMNRYSTPVRYKGTYETSSLARAESDRAATLAMQEGARLVRVTTALQPRGEAPTGGTVRVYQQGATGTPELIGERAVNMGAVRAAQVGATPMRRALPDYFDVTYNPRLESDIITPKNVDVTKALMTARGIDPHQTQFPMSDNQLSFLNSTEGRAIREKLDLNSKRLTTKEVLAMTEDEAKAALLEPEKGVPAMAGVVVTPTEANLNAIESLSRLNVGEQEAADFLKTLPRGITPENQLARTLAWLQSKCLGG